MVKPEWGKKITCTDCGAKFYDFKKAKIICPKCEAEVKPVSKSKRGVATTAAVPAPAADVKKVEGEIDPIDDIEDLEDDVDDSEDDALIVVDDGLDDDDDDLEEVKEHMMPGDED